MKFLKFEPFIVFVCVRRHNFSCTKILMAYFVSDSVLSIEKFTEGKTKLLPQEAYTFIKTVAIKESYILI